MRDRIRQALTVAITVMVVSGMLISGALPGGSPVGTAQAGDFGFQDCDISDSLVGAIITSFTAPNGDECRFNPEDGTDSLESWEEVRQMETNLNISTTQASNVRKNSRQIAWTKAKLEIVQSLNNGANATEAENNATEVVQDYYAAIQRNRVARWNSVAEQFLLTNGSIQYKANVSAGVDNEILWSDTNVTVHEAGENHTIDWSSATDDYTNHTVELANGTHVEAYLIMFATDVDGDGNDEHIGMGPQSLGNWENQYPYLVNSWSDYEHAVNNAGDHQIPWYEADDPTQSGSTFTEVHDDGEFTKEFWKLDQAENQIVANLGTYTDNVYANYSKGDLDTSDLLDPVTLASQANSDYNDTGYYAYSAAEMAYLGLDGNLNHSHTIELENGTQMEGSLYYTGDDKANISTLEDVNPSNYNGTFYLARSDKGLHQIGQNFTIAEAVNTQTGEEVNETTFDSRDMTTTNASQLQDDLDELREMIEDQESVDTAGGGGSGSGSSNGKIIAVVVAAAAAGLLLNGRNGGGMNRGRR